MPVLNRIARTAAALSVLTVGVAGFGQASSAMEIEPVGGVDVLACVGGRFTIQTWAIENAAFTASIATTGLSGTAVSGLPVSVGSIVSETGTSQLWAEGIYTGSLTSSAFTVVVATGVGGRTYSVEATNPCSAALVAEKEAADKAAADAAAAKAAADKAAADSADAAAVDAAAKVAADAAADAAAAKLAADKAAADAAVAAAKVSAGSALPSTGSNSTNILWTAMALVVVGAGATMVARPKAEIVEA